MKTAATELLGRRFRASSLYRLVAMEDLSSAERDRLGVLAPTSEFSAVLLPNVPGLSAKAVCGNTVKLLHTFRVASTLTPRLQPDIEADPDLLTKLVLDSVLEVEHEGHFVGGAQAVQLFRLKPIDQGYQNATARLSGEALSYGETLALRDATALSTRLYQYNCIPVSPRWTRQIGTEEILAEWMGLGQSSPTTLRLKRDWTEVAESSTNSVWRRFRRNSSLAGTPFKLYLNPHPDFFREALDAAIPAFAQYGFRSFKLGRQLQSVLRPDKLVAYAHSRSQIDSAARAILRRLRGMPAQAVPFTAGVDEDGLVSWGMDPPQSERVSRWQGSSWRKWITDRLAVALIAAREEGAQSAQGFALSRLALEGVDPASWAPSDVEWAG
jgi:hypothetical protein